MAPFSLADLGLSEDEIASLDSADQPPAAPAEPEPEMAPFSLADLGLSEDEAATTDASEQPAEDLGDITPFSATDWSFQEQEQPAADETGSFDLPDELRPFSLDDLDISTSTGSGGMDLGTLPTSLQPFSLDEIGESAAPPQRAPDLQPPLSMPDEEEPASEPTGYSWQQPAAKPNTDFLRNTGKQESTSGPSIFAKLKQRHSELPVEEPPPLSPVSDEETDMSLFSHDDVSLRDDLDSTGQPSGTIQDTAEASSPVEPQPSTSPSAEPDMTPFSLADLGLSEDEIASLGLAEGAPEPAAPEPVEPAPAADEPDMTPFSLADLGLSEDEIASLGLEAGEAPAADQQASDTSALDEQDGENAGLQPFSLDDLDLDSSMTFGSADATSELGLTDEELAGMDLGPLEGAEKTAAGMPARSDADVYTVDTGDEVLDRLITLGQRQGYVDLTDIIAEVTNPEEESERIEEIGEVLHRAGIQIRDGDEIIDMDAEEEEYIAYADEGQADLEPATVDDSAEPDMTPFSLADLGLSPEEIAALGLEEESATAAPQEPSAAPAMPEPAADEPDMTPFSLADLGLSEDEIAALGLTDQAGTAPAQPPPADEPEMTPFSLTDLGLSPEEIAALDAATANAAPTQEPAETSVSDADDLDAFDFSAVEEQIKQIPTPTPRTRTREEEAPAPLSPEDAAFTPEALDALDEIWEEQAPAAPSIQPAQEAQPPIQATPAPEPAPVERKVAPSAVIERLPPRGTESTRRSGDQAPTRSEPPRPPREAERPARSEPPRPPREAERPARSAPWRAQQSPTAFIPTGDTALDGYLLQLEAEPNNDRLRLAVARVGGQSGRTELAIQQYKALIKSGIELEEVTSDLEELVVENQEQPAASRLYRLLGDAYTKQNRFREAVEAYSWTFGR
jgi:uncharacterized protein YjiS (DUF1127 family)